MSIIVNLALKYAMARAREASTWKGLILVIGGSWAASNSTSVDALVPICLAIVGFLGTLMPDKLPSKPVIEVQPEVIEESPIEEEEPVRPVQTIVKPSAAKPSAVKPTKPSAVKPTKPSAESEPYGFTNK